MPIIHGVVASNIYCISRKTKLHLLIKCKLEQDEKFLPFYGYFFSACIQTDRLNLIKIYQIYLFKYYYKFSKRTWKMLLS